MRIAIPVYQVKEGAYRRWVTFSLGPHTQTLVGKSPIKMERTLIRDLTKIIETLHTRDLYHFQLMRGVHLKRVRLELSLRSQGKKRRRSGLFPLIVEPRWLTSEKRVEIAYHPFDRANWFSILPNVSLEEQATAALQTFWAELSDDAIDDRKSNEKDSLTILSFSAQHRTLLDALPDASKGIWGDLETESKEPSQRAINVVSTVGINQTSLALNSALFLGQPRPDLRARLAAMMRPGQNTPTVLLGPPGVGKTTLLHRWIDDLTKEQGYASHQNPDRIHKVWSISGRALIAGMSYLGEWEARCMELIQEARTNAVILLVEDLHMWHRLGRSSGSSRCLADVFRGPLARREIAMVARCTTDEFAVLEAQHESFASVWSPLVVPEPTTSETLRFLLYEARRLERDSEIRFSPFAFRTILELSNALFPSQAFPGKALELLRNVARSSHGAEEITSYEVTEALTNRTGLPNTLFNPNDTLSMETLKERFETRVMGQDDAVEVACEVVLKFKSGMLDPKRPCAVLLFAGPTGTGKTELAKTLAHVLYSSKQRLIRLDMSEFSGPDAPNRLLGDAWSPKGVLTQQIHDQPFSVVLLDEIEKAHPRVLGLLLQLFDEGRLTDAQGQVADFRNSILIMTSNLGSSDAPLMGFEGSERGEKEHVSRIDRAVRAFFAPELFNRMDRVVPFRPLTPQSARLVAEKECTRLVQRQGLTERDTLVTWTPAVLDVIIQEAFDARDGARSVKRYLDDRIGTLLVDDLAAAGEHMMRVLRIFHVNGDFKIFAESLEEVALLDEEMALEGAEDRSVRSLAALVPQALHFVDETLSSPRMKTLTDKIRKLVDMYNNDDSDQSDNLFALDKLRHSLRAHQEHFEELLYAWDPRSVLEHPDRRSPLLIDETRSFSPGKLFAQGVGFASRDALLNTIAHVYFLQRIVMLIDEPGQHEVFLRLTPLHTPPNSNAEHSLMNWLTHAYSSSGWGHLARESAVWRPDGSIQEGAGESSTAKAIVLRIVGTCARDFFALEEGCHVWNSTGKSPEIVRVDLYCPEEGRTAKTLLQDLQSGVRAFEDALSRDEAREVKNPVGLTPVVRRMAFTPVSSDVPSLLEVEEFRSGVVFSKEVKANRHVLKTTLPRFWRLYMSRSIHAESLGYEAEPELHTHEDEGGV